MTSDREHVEVPEDVLERLVSFADTHGVEYGSPDLYFAVRDGKLALDHDDVEPYFPWKEAWSDRQRDTGSSQSASK